MKPWIAKFRAEIARLAFWRKPGNAVSEPVEAPAQSATSTPELSPELNPDPVPAAKQNWFTRLKLRLPWRHPAVEDPVLDLDQKVVVARPSADQLAATESEAPSPAPQLSFFARLKNKLSRTPKLDQGLSASKTADDSDRRENLPKIDQADSASALEDTPKLGLVVRLRALLSRKWVWLSAAGAVLLVLMGTVVTLLLQAGQEKEKLQAELREAKKKIEQQAVVKIQRATPIQAPLELGKLQREKKPEIGQTNPMNNSGDCMVSDKESVQRSLKDCIEAFNQMATDSRRSNRK